MSVPAAIVVEGGGMRGIFSSGVLDVFLEQSFNPFQLAIGSSAGACNLASHLAGQHDRNRRCYTTQMSRPEFISGRRYLRGGHWLDLDYLWDAFQREDPLDVQGATANATKLVVTTTAADTGLPEFFEPNADELLEVLRASCAVPLLYRKFVELSGRPYTDGGVSAAIPVEEAFRRGARRILVLRSRPADYVKEPRLESVIGALALRKHPALARAIRSAHKAYGRALAFIRNPPAECTVLEIAPKQALRTGRTTRDVGALEEDYALGRKAGISALEEWARMN